MFDDERDVNRILSNQRWSFNKRLVVVKQYDKGIHLNSLSFETTMFWVQLHDIPIHFMCTKVVEKICENIGEVGQSIGAETEEGGSFIRVRVKINISLHLCRGSVITLESREKSWVLFKYERLRNFCFWCGKLVHGERDYLLLKAPPYRPSNQEVIFVPNFYDKSGLQDEDMPRTGRRHSDTVVRDRVATVEDDSIMESEEFGDGFNDGINVGEVTNSKTSEEINLAAGIVDEVIQSNQDSLPIPKINDLKHDSRELTSANSALTDSISREGGLEKFMACLDGGGNGGE